METHRSLAKLVFRIRASDGRKTWFGTGFFISSDGLALTAFHNLPPNVLASPEDTPVDAWLDDGTPLRLQWILPDNLEDRNALKEYDVAVLRALDYTPSADMICAMYSTLPEREDRAEFWGAKQVFTTGFTLEHGFGLEEPIVGSISSSAAIQDPKVVRPGSPNPVVYAKEALAFGADFEGEFRRLQGLSGGPLYSTRFNAIVGVVFAVREDMQRVYACELCHLWSHFQRIRTFMKPLPRVEPRGESREVTRRRFSRIAIPLAVALLLLLAIWRVSRLGSEPELSLVCAAERLDLRDGNETAVPLSMEPGHALQKGQRARFLLRVSKPGFLYLINDSSHEKPDRIDYTLLFPSPASRNASSAVGPSEIIRIPERSWFERTSGEERELFWIVFSLDRLDEIEQLIRFQNSNDLGVVPVGNAGAISRLIRNPVGASRRDERGGVVFEANSGRLLVGRLVL
jgi:hypothetical protein